MSFCSPGHCQENVLENTAISVSVTFPVSPVLFATKWFC